MALLGDDCLPQPVLEELLRRQWRFSTLLYNGHGAIDCNAISPCRIVQRVQGRQAATLDNVTPNALIAQ